MRRILSISVSALSLLLFAVPAEAQTLRTIYSFGSGSDGNVPSGLAFSANGRLYGTTVWGGNADSGTLFSVDLAGNETILHSFNPTVDGLSPFAPVLVSGDGSIYGTAAAGGTYGLGTIFKYDPAGNFTTIHNFGDRPNDGNGPFSTLVRDASGNLYGTTQIGGDSDSGTLFKLDTSLNETILHSFNGSDGLIPRSGVLRDSAGNFYGTTAFGGQTFCGVVFKIDSAGSETILHNLNCGTDGFNPWSTPIRDTAGNLYVTAAQGGQYGNGVLFKIAPDGTETILHAFSGANGDGAEPFAAVVMDAAGNLFGTASQGGDQNLGILYKLDPNGNQTILHTFTGQNGDGANPGNLAIDAAGDLFGVTTSGGVNQLGTIFEYSATPSIAIPSMLSYVDSLLAQRAINRGQANSLTKQLQQISKLILSGKINGAVNNLTSFISGVNDLVASRVLDQTQAARLIAGANGLIATLSA